MIVWTAATGDPVMSVLSEAGCQVVTQSGQELPDLCSGERHTSRPDTIYCLLSRQEAFTTLRAEGNENC